MIKSVGLTLMRLTAHTGEVRNNIVFYLENV